MDRLQAFIASIANLAVGEARKAKVLYVRNELAEYEAQLERARSFGMIQLVFVLIPFFWPIIYLQRRSMLTSAQLGYRRIANALDVWRTDLGDDAPALTAQLERLAGTAQRLFPWSKPQSPRQLSSGR